MCEVFGKESSEFLVDIYYKQLCDYPEKDVLGAISTAIGTLRWFPKPVELTELITGESHLSIEDKAQAQALLVVDAIRRHGAYASVRFEDPVTTRTVQGLYGTWPKACELREEAVKWFVKDFVATYKAYSAQRLTERGHLPGIVEIENSANGFINNIPDPIYITHNPVKQIEQNKTPNQ